MRLQKVYVCFIAGASIRAKLHCFPLSCSLSAFRPHHCEVRPGGGSSASEHDSGKKISSNVMYLCSGIKQVVNVINQTNRRLGMLMQNVSHSGPLIKQETQGVKYLVEFTEVKGWPFPGLPGCVPPLTHSILFPGQRDFQQS